MGINQAIVRTTVTGYTPNYGTRWNNYTVYDTGMYSSTHGAITSNGLQYVGVGRASGTLYNIIYSVSGDINTWGKAAISGSLNNFNGKGIAYGAGLFVAVGAGNTTFTVITSSDGVNWTSRSAVAGSYQSVCWTGTSFIAVGSNVAMTSPDGITWTSRTCPAMAWNKVNHNGSGTILAAAYNNLTAIMKSTDDGASWAQIATPDNGAGFGAVAYGPGKWLAMGEAGTVRAMTSIDNGDTWTLAGDATVNAGGWRDIVWSGVAYAVVGISGTDRFMYSTTGNASTWIPVTTPIGPQSTYGAWAAITRWESKLMCLAAGGSSAGQTPNVIGSPPFIT